MRDSPTSVRSDAAPKCAWCDYDLRASPSNVCPECGRTTLDPVLYLRVSDATKRRASAGAAIAVTSIVGMFPIETSYAPMPAQMHLLVGLVLISVVCFGPMLVLRHEARAIRRIQRSIWLQCSIWLLLPWLSAPALVFAAFQWFRYRTQGMRPGDYAITLEHLSATNTAMAAIPLLLVIGIIAWCLRWRAIRSSAGLPSGYWPAAAPMAVAAIVLSAVLGGFSMLFAMMGD